MACRPLKSLQELLQWTESVACHSHDRREKASRALFQQDGDGLNSVESAPRLMVCHDMMGGYREDRLYSGCENPSAYTFYHWSAIDEFVYFSHHLVTIPPCGWVEAAHTNGVPIYGTFITEGGGGHEICQELLVDQKTVAKAVERLVAISKHHRLDGWLVDIQNHLVPSQVRTMQQFLRQLTGAMHSAIPHSRVIWYDAVTRDGRLWFQNRLSEENEVFFGLCDGIFLNYWWTPQGMLSSKTRAGSRVRDVYVGVDVFGRGTRDGGGFNVAQPVAESRWIGLSAALFAPGWTHEVAARHCPVAEDVFWSRLRPLVGVRGPTSLPLETDFCQGRGLRRFANGQATGEPSGWHRLAAQQLQPSFPQRPAPTGQRLKDAYGRPVDTSFRLSAPDALGLPEHDAAQESMLGRVAEQRRIELACSAGLEPLQPDWEVHHTGEEGFSGGGCLAVKNASERAGVFRLFACDIKLGTEQMKLFVTYAMKVTNGASEKSAICLDLDESDRSGISRRILEPPVALEFGSALMDSCERILAIRPEEEQQPMAARSATSTQWEERRYLVSLGGAGRTCRLVSIGLYLPAGGRVLLGRLLLRKQPGPLRNLNNLNMGTLVSAFLRR